MASFNSMNNQQKPPTEDELRRLYDQVMQGFRDSPSPLDDVRISTGTDDLTALIEQYREDTGSAEPPSYDSDRRMGMTASPPVTEKGMY